jgi:hypothetical protein
VPLEPWFDPIARTGTQLLPRGVGVRWQGQAAEAAPEVGAAVAVESHRAGAGEEWQNGSSPWLAVALLWLGAAGETRRTGGDGMGGEDLPRRGR